MSGSDLILDVSHLKELAERLSQCPEVNKLDDAEDVEAWTLAHAFADLEESFRRYVDELLPELMRRDLSPSEVPRLLLEIGEEFRHILYHIKDPKFYRYLQDA